MSNDIKPPSFTLKVMIKQVYGREIVYPLCPMAEGFCRLLQQETLTDRDIETLKGMGFTFVDETPRRRL